MRTRTLKKLAGEPILLVCALWPLVLLAPHVPGIPRPSIQGLPWRQELLFALPLCVSLALSARRGLKVNDSTTHANRLHVFTLLAAVLFTSWVWLSALWAVNPFSAENLASQWSAYTIFFALSVSAASSPRASRLAFVAVAAVVWILGISCAVETWVGAALTDGNLRADLKPLLRGSGGFGEMMAVAAPLFAALALYLRRPARAVTCGATAALAWLATLQSLERAPFVGGAVGLSTLFAVALLKRNCRPRRPVRAVALAAALAAVFASQWLPSFSAANASPAHTNTTVTRLQTSLKDDASARARFLFWGVGLEMIRANPLLGVGANNYEAAFPEARARFAERHPGSALVSMNEHLLVVYAHNEYLQLAAELGAVGLALFLLFASALAYTFLRALRHPTNALPALGAGAGMLAFAISSGASASSFRYFGGGLLFFFAASVVARVAASVKTARAESRESSLTSNSSLTPSPSFTFSPRARRVLLHSALAVSFVVTFGAALRAAGTVLHGMAQSSADPARAERLYKASLSADAWSAQTHFGYGAWLYARGRAAEAVPQLRYAAARGYNSSTCYARLAAAESEAGDSAAAERTLALAVRAYPRSIFLRVRHAQALEGSNRSAEAALEIAAAELIDSRSARGWRQLIFNDIDAAVEAARRDPAGVAMPGELQPEDAVFAVLQENERRFPESARAGWRAQMRTANAQMRSFKTQ